MPNSPLPSPIANMTRARQQMSAIRQQLSLEPSSAGMRSVAPAGQPQAPAYDPGAEQQAMTAPPPAPMPPQGDPNQPVQIPPEQRQEMLAKIQGFIDQHAPQQQALIDQQRTDPQNVGQNPQQAPAGESPQEPPSQVIKDPKILRQLAPLTEFFNQNGRLPSPDELQHLAASRELHTTLGRKPTDTEVNLYRTKPNSLK